MTPSISFFPPAAPPSAVAANALASTAGKGAPEAPFSRMLDRAVQEPPGRKNKSQQSERPNPAKPGGHSAKQTDQAERHDEAKTGLETASRQTPRLKNKKSERDEAESLAGACSVTAPTTPPEDQVTVVEAADGSAELVAVADQTSGAAASADTAEPVFPTEAESTPSGELNLKTLVAPAEPETTETVGASLVNTLTPLAVTETTGTKASPAENQSLQLGEARGASPADPATAVPVIPGPSEPGIPTAESKTTPTIASAEFPESGTAPVATEEVVAIVATNGGTEAPDSAPEEVRRSLRAVRRARLEAQESAAGIGGAKSSETMKTAIKKEELAGGTEQFLPVSSPNALSALRNLPGELNRKAPGSFSVTNALDAAGNPVAAPAHSAATAEGDALSIRSNNLMGRISEVVSREVRMFKRGGDDLVEVVLTPDTKTQISLRLQWREGQVEVQARCDLGDYQSLNTQWPQLQASLASHGVRLSHLSERVTTGFTEFFNNAGFPQQRGREEQSHQAASQAESLPALPAPVAKPGVAPAVRRSNRLFDSWA